MDTRRVADLTTGEFRTLISDVVRDELRTETDVVRRRSVDEVLDSVIQNIIVPSPGEPSTLELLRDDRDR